MPLASDNQPDDTPSEPSAGISGAPPWAGEPVGDVPASPPPWESGPWHGDDDLVSGRGGRDRDRAASQQQGAIPGQGPDSDQRTGLERETGVDRGTGSQQGSGIGSQQENRAQQGSAARQGGAARHGGAAQQNGTAARVRGGAATRGGAQPASSPAGGSAAGGTRSAAATTRSPWTRRPLVLAGVVVGILIIAGVLGVGLGAFGGHSAAPDPGCTGYRSTGRTDTATALSDVSAGKPAATLGTDLRAAANAVNLNAAAAQDIGDRDALSVLTNDLQSAAELATASGKIPTAAKNALTRDAANVARHCGGPAA